MSTPVQIPFDNSFAKLPAGFYTKLPATAVKAPKMIAYNQGLAKDLGITGGSESTLAEIFFRQSNASRGRAAGAALFRASIWPI